tara:strand:- start:1389 stop:2825 length:1437 start_codon:yes stop_codon:yes gene_type:complete
MANTIIAQSPLYNKLPVGQEFMFSIINTDTVAIQKSVKFVAYVYISDNQPPNTNLDTDLIGTFKTIPNNKGTGIFDFRGLLESYVSPDNLSPNTLTKYKGVAGGGLVQYPIHIIDKFSKQTKVVRYVAFKFTTEYLDTTATPPVLLEDPDATSPLYQVFDGYLKYSNVLHRGGIGMDFGFDLQDFDLGSVKKKFLTNAPTTQYANISDYGTLSFFTKGITSGTDVATKIILTYYPTIGTAVSETVHINQSNGAYSVGLGGLGNISKSLLYFGCFPANLRNWSSTFQAYVTAGTIEGGYYTVQAFNVSAVASSLYTINVNCPDLKGYESIRLAWLNQWGVWDYYTFTKKSIKTISTQGSTYEQLGGTWNDSLYTPQGYKGGKKAFRVNATEKITMNTDFVNESESEWFEELINSPEVYILKGFTTEPSVLGVTKLIPTDYATPARLITSSYTKKTIANDKLMQYTFEVEKSKTLRTQSV